MINSKGGGTTEQDLFLVSVCSNNNDLLDGEAEEYSYLQGIYSSEEKAIDAVECLRQQLMTSPRMLRQKKAYGWSDEDLVIEITNAIKMVKVIKNKDYYTNDARVALASFYYSE